MSILTATFWLSLEMSYFPSKYRALRSHTELWDVQEAAVRLGPSMALGVSRSLYSSCPCAYVLAVKRSRNRGSDHYTACDSGESQSIFKNIHVELFFVFRKTHESEIMPS